MPTRPPVSRSLDIDDRPPPRREATSPVLSVSPDHVAGEAVTDLRPEADRLRAMLASVLEEIRRRDETMAAGLQERLRLGARMLRALQVQIDRGEAAAAAAQRSLNERLAAELKEAEEAMSQRLEACLDEAVDRLDARARERAAAHAATEQQLGDLRVLAESISGTIETTEVCVAALSARVAAIERDQARRRDEAAVMLDELERVGIDARRTATALLERLEQTSRRAEELERKLHDRASDGAAVACHAEQQVEQLSALSQQLEPVHEACERIESALAQLQPWRGLLLDAPVDDRGVPAPIARIVECVREGVGTSVMRLSASLGALARQVGEPPVPGGVDEAPPGPPGPAIVTTVPPPAAAPKPTLRFGE